jgi:hypothetical protein
MALCAGSVSDSSLIEQSAPLGPDMNRLDALPIVVFWFVTSCGLVGGYQSSSTYKIRRRHKPENHNQHLHRHEKIEIVARSSDKMSMLFDTHRILTQTTNIFIHQTGNVTTELLNAFFLKNSSQRN